MIKPRDTVLVVDDEDAVRWVIKALLETEGFRVIEAPNAQVGLRAMYEERPDLVLLDVLMPGRDGRELLRLLREIDDHMPVIMLTALSQDHDKVHGLQNGADDYVTKPFHNEELIARIRTVLRRTRQVAKSRQRTYQDGLLHIDFEARQLLLKGTLVNLSPKQWRLLECLVGKRDEVVSRTELLRYTWGNGYEQEGRYLKVFISHLRKKLGDNPKKPRYIHTVREQGYLFESHK